VTWLFEDETSVYAEAVLDALAVDHEALAPSIWSLGVSNVLLVGERRGRITPAQSTAFWESRTGAPETQAARRASRGGTGAGGGGPT
jgi:hypothetical protein